MRRVPIPATLRQLLLDRAAASPSTLAFADAERTITFGALADRAEELSRGLAALGVRPRDRVALALPSGVRFAETFWALQLLGATPCAFNPYAPAETLARRMESIRPRLAVTAGLEIPASSTPAPAPEPDPRSLAFLQRTSGTTGEPRAAMITQRNALLGALEPAVAADDVLVSWVPPWHDMGLVRFTIMPVTYGTPCHLVAPAVRTIPEWLATVGRVGGTVTIAPDFAYRIALRMVDPATVDLSSLRVLGSGGEPVQRTTVEQFEDRFGMHAVTVPGYGLAEATLGVSSHPPGSELVVDERGNVSCGPALPGVEIRVEDGSADEPGEILVRGGTVFAGYLDAPEETAEVLRDGWLHTGDAGYLDGEGRLFVLGRRRAMIKRAGAVVAPRELEEAAHRVPGVRLAAAVGSPGAGLAAGERVVVVVEAEPDAAAEDLKTGVTAAIRSALGFAPHRVVVVEPRTIPLSASGKIRYAEVMTAAEGQAVAPA